MPRLSCADIYPARPIHWILGFAAGGAPDVLARVMAPPLSDRLGQTLVIENRPGAGTNLATEAVARALPDGYSLLLIALPGTVTSAILYPDANLDVVRDIAAVASIGTTPFVMVVNPSFPAKTVAEFIAYAKANPGKINIASTGTGNLTYMAADLFKMMTGLDMIQVPARSEALAQNDLLGGQSHVLFDPLLSSIGNIREGRVRVLGVTTPARLDVLPNVPTVAETVPGYDVRGWLGVGAPKGMPADIIDKLNQAVNAVLADPQTDARLASIGTTPLKMTPAEFGKVIADEAKKWAKVIAFEHAKGD